MCIFIYLFRSPGPFFNFEKWVQFLDQEDPLEEGMATHSSILAWRIPQTEEPGKLQSIGSQRVGHDWNDLAWTQIEDGEIN